MSQFPRSDRPFHRDPDWYRATYNAAVGHVLLHDTTKQKRNALDEAASLARELGEEIEIGLIEASGATPWARRQQAAQTLKPFLLEIEPTALILLAGILRRTRRDARDEERPPQQPFPVDPELPTVDGDPRNRFRKTASVGGPRGRAFAARSARLTLLAKLEDDSITHSDLIEWVYANLRLDYRARYNLACYFSRRGDEPGKDAEKNYRSALRELEASLSAAPGDIVGWAQKDPALRGVRESKVTRSRFRELIDELETSSRLPPEVDPEDAHDRLLGRIARSLSRVSGAEVVLPVGRDQPDIIVQIERRRFAGEIRAEEELSQSALRRALQRLEQIVHGQPEVEAGFLAVPDSARVSPVAAPPGIALIRASDADDWLRARVERGYDRS